MQHVTVPPYVQQTLTRLRGAGFLAYPVGGCVRDVLLGAEPHDWDITTSAMPGEVKAALGGVTIVDTGLKHGTVTAVTCGVNVEVTTFRADGEYLDGRRPDAVMLGVTLEDDLSRRDFTINAMALGEDGVIDPFGGQVDLKNRVIRAVGVPEQRFGEDGLRILRALRFAAVLEFEIESATANAVRGCRDMLAKISRERIRDELVRMLEGANTAAVLREFTDVFCAILPEIAPAVGFIQNNPHHVYDVWEHTLAAVDAAPRDHILRLALLLHDLGKPRCYSEDTNGVGHFYAHGEVGYRIARELMRRLRFDSASTQSVCELVKYHDCDLFSSAKSIARWLGKLGEPALRRLIAVKRADNMAQSPGYSRQVELNRAEIELERILCEGECHTLKALAVRGGDIIALGAAGVQTGRVLDTLLQEVIDGRLQNEKSTLLCRAAEILVQRE